MILNEREIHIIMNDVKWNWATLALASAPWSINNLTISSDFCLIAIESGHSILQNIFHKNIIVEKLSYSSICCIV